ncbi:MAG: DUF5822 domain-containing protein [Halanaeroarchaeum sp.]
MPERVSTTDPDGVDYGWVVQVTFVLSMAIGVPTIAALSLARSLPTWSARLQFALRTGAVVWLVVGVLVFLYARTVAT